MTTKTKYSYLLLATIFFMALFLRLYRLNIDSPAIYADEAGHYYYYNLIKDNIGGPINQIIYRLFSATWLVGVNPLGARLFSAFYGSLIVLVGFFFAKALNKLSGSKLYLRVALVFAFLISLLPWNYAISRIGYSHIPIITIMTLLHLTIYLNAKNWQGKLMFLIPFAIGGYFYPSLITMSPFVLIVPAIDILKDKSINKKYLFSAISLFIIVVLYVLLVKYQVFNREARGLDLAIWRDVNVTADSNLYRGLARLSTPTIFSFGMDPEKLANKIVFNYPISVASEFASNYLSFFSPDFLFLKGDQVLRHSTGMVGNFYLFLLPFIIYGGFKFYALRTKHSLLITLWILASPLSATITKDGATYLLRVITLMPFLTYFAALGIVEFYELLKIKFAKITYFLLLSVVTLFSAYYYFYGYFHVYPALAADSFEYGFKELAQFQTKNPGKMLIIWDDKYPFSLFCFWQNLPYTDCKFEDTNTRVEIGTSRLDLALPEVIFSLPSSPTDLDLVVNGSAPKYIALPAKYKKNFQPLPKNYKLIETVKNPNLSTAFEIYSVGN
jgi:hypothetical protein